MNHNKHITDITFEVLVAFHIHYASCIHWSKNQLCFCFQRHWKSNHTLKWLTSWH